MTYYEGQLVRLREELGIWRVVKVVPTRSAESEYLLRLKHTSGPISEFGLHVMERAGFYTAITHEIDPLGPLEQLADQAK